MSSDRFSFPNTGFDLVEFTNNSGLNINVTFRARTTYSVTKYMVGLTDMVIKIRKGESKLVGPFSPSVFNDADGLVQMSWRRRLALTFRVISVEFDDA